MSSYSHDAFPVVNPRLPSRAKSTACIVEGTLVYSRRMAGYTVPAEAFSSGKL